MVRFFDVESDKSVDDNVRWAVAQKLISRILETCPLNYLPEILIEYFSDFKNRLDAETTDPFENYLLMREQTNVFLFIEIIVRRLELEQLKKVVSKQIFGQNSAENELFKFLIDVSSQAQRKLKFNDLITQLPELNSVNQIQRRYSCSAYTLLSSIIVKSQVKEKIFTNYLFGGWESMIDCSSEDVYNFYVQTNFNSINLQTIE